MKLKLLIIGCFISFFSWSQFPGAVGEIGSTAIHQDSSIIVAWADNCSVVRGYQDITNPSLGLVSDGVDHYATGPASNQNTVSLGDGGSATVSFAKSITNGPGADFVVFENAFSNSFLELAFVEVSSDGVHFVRFPAVSNTQDTLQLAGFSSVGDPTLLHNLAGKYRSGYGVPFDLEDLKDSVGIELNFIHSVRIIDVVGNINTPYASFDINGNKINDPFPTPFPTGGFDLSAVGVINEGELSVSNEELTSIYLYPNPVHDWGLLNIKSNTPISQITVTNSGGSINWSGSLFDLKNASFTAGVYFLTVETEYGVNVFRVMKL